MNKSRNHKNGKIPLEQRVFEALHKQIHRFDEPVSFAGKNGYAGGGNADFNNRGAEHVKPIKRAIYVKLLNGKILHGTYVSFDSSVTPRSKLFFPTGTKNANGDAKNLCISSPIGTQSPDCEPALIEDINEYLQDILEQSLAEFPEWLKKWGRCSEEKNPCFSYNEICDEWKYKKVQFGIFRLAQQAGFFTDYHPAKAERPDIIEINFYSEYSTLPRGGARAARFQ
jgi:hypothetical protein